MAKETGKKKIPPQYLKKGGMSSKPMKKGDKKSPKYM